MSGILVITEPRDLHAYLVEEALKRKSAEVVLWHGTDFPSRQTASVSTSSTGSSWEISGPDLAIADRAFRTVWNRRPTDAVVPDCVHPADRGMAELDCQQFVWSLWRLVAPDAFWVNPVSRYYTSILKPLQARLAVRAGLAIPPTLFSNDPARIRDFLRRYRDRTVYKSFRPNTWKTEDGLAVLFTSPVGEDDLPEDELLQASPGIFQVRVPKAHELRVTFLGDRPLTAELRSQQAPGGEIDWRAGSKELEVVAGELPEEVADACRRLMAELGIVFGCFDFVVTPEGEHVFLEVNPMGQFLFVEQLCPDLRLLDAFSEFLIQGRCDFDWPTGAADVALADVWPAAERAWAAAAERHVVRAPRPVDETG